MAFHAGHLCPAGFSDYGGHFTSSYGSFLSRGQMQCVVSFVLHPVILHSALAPSPQPACHEAHPSPAAQGAGCWPCPLFPTSGTVSWHTGESRGQARATPVSLGFAGQPQAGGLQDLRLGAARGPLSRWFMAQILQPGLLLAVGMVGQGLPFMFRVCTSSWTIKLPLPVIHVLACYCQWAAQSCHHVQ